MDAEQKTYWRDILDAAERIRSYTVGTSQEQFLSDVKTQDAVLRRFEIVGEACAHLDETTRNSFPELPFYEMRGMRNVIAHAYGDVDLDIVWETVQADVPKLIETLGSFFARE